MRRLPIPEMLGDAFQLVWYEFPTILRLTWLPLLIVAVVPFLPWIIFGVPPTFGGIDLTFQNVIPLFAGALVTLVAAVMPLAAIQRLILFGDRNEGRLLPRLPGRLEFLYLAAVFIAGVAWLAAVGAVIGLGLLTPLAFVLLAVLFIVAFVVVWRLLLIFPVAAVERRLDVRETWRLSRGNTWRLFFILLLLSLVLSLPTLFMLLLDAIFGLPAIAASVLASIILSFFYALLSNALTGGVLAYCYKYLKGLEPDDLVDPARLQRPASLAVLDTSPIPEPFSEGTMPAHPAAWPAIAEPDPAQDFFDEPRLPVLPTAGVAYAFVWQRFGAVFKLLWWPLLAITILRYVFMPDLLVPSLKQELTARFWALSIGLGIVDIVVLCFCAAAIHRWVLVEAPANSLPRLRVGRTEILFLGAAAVIGLIGAVVTIGSAAVVGGLGGIVTAIFRQSGSAQVETLQLLVAVISVGAGIAGFLVSLRFVFTFPLIVATSQIYLRQSWRMTQWNWWRVIGVTLIVSLPAIVGLVASEIIIAPLFHVPLGELESAARRVSAALAAFNYIVLLLEVALGSAAVSIAYRTLAAQLPPRAQPDPSIYTATNATAAP